MVRPHEKQTKGSKSHENSIDHKPKADCDKDENNTIPSLNNEQYQQFLGMFAREDSPTKNEISSVANVAGNLDPTGRWIVDSGATDHITHRLDWFNNDFKYTWEPPVTIPNGSSISVEGKGSCTLPNGIHIKDVLYVPSFTCDLLSVSRLSRDLQCAVTFFPEFCVMHTLNSRRLIGMGKCKDGLYRMSLVGSKRNAMAVSFDVWHKRLGHASSKKLSSLDCVKNSSLKSKNSQGQTHQVTFSY
ncbi:hypothetical protein QVD17_29913 [Tagetes erecta]|uniref:Retrovirus-related Pol polyprotein from transposon TNT 1-94-like beta-barrel domain-containing protein n=1 Tax=Tagetes erecta TaxID=13708 RepID=A0AAD8K0X5_TARER|nr:hypothetical protein QVD17_29913 [Tagetes erecta]